MGRWRWCRLLVLGVVLLNGALPTAAQSPSTAEEEVLGVIRWNNAALPAAYRDWDLSGLDQYLTGPELIERATDIQNMIFQGGEFWFEPRSFQVSSVTFPDLGRATVETIETWYEWVRMGTQTLDREWVAPQRYELEFVDGAW